MSRKARVVYTCREVRSINRLGAPPHTRWWWKLYSGNNQTLVISRKYYSTLGGARRNFRRVVKLLSQNYGSPPIKEVIGR